MSSQLNYARKRPADEELSEKRSAPSVDLWEPPRNMGDFRSSSFNTHLQYSEEAMSGDYLYAPEDMGLTGLWPGDDVTGCFSAELSIDISLSDFLQTPTAENDAATVSSIDESNLPTNVPVVVPEVVQVPEQNALPAVKPQGKSSTEGPSEDEWAKQKPLLLLLYAEEGLTLPSVMRIIKTAGFLEGASEKMYKTRFDKWGVQKNERSKPRRRALKAKDSSAFSENDLRGMIEGVRIICESNLQGTHGVKWVVDDQYQVLEDEWDDAFGNIVWFIKQRTKNATEPSTATPEIDSIHDDIKPVVDALGLFSLPIILALVFRMCDELKEGDLIDETLREFLLKCQKLSEKAATPRHEPFTKMLKHAYSVSQGDRDSLQRLIEVTFSFYIGVVSTYGAAESTTVLSLISFYLVYVNPEPGRLKATFGKLERLLGRSEKDNGEDDDATLEILRLILFILQRMDNRSEL
ncbi:hypothetical protein NKR23_g1128 [Pleurostoma richardsiae]|uniref:Clr5 domain-containing protein n=1 Tax=Pleurostoma richardsiae TaxID=41990 RepID=A0AA38RRB1_9PEZI|nr:hypothetical protein NKR23_g1128 [Pleurostoma richardsiae]